MIKHTHNDISRKYIYVEIFMILMSFHSTKQVFKVSHLRSSIETIHGFRQYENSIRRRRIILLKQSVILM